MIMINNFRKLLLLERLNLGYECTGCKLSFGSRKQLMNHLDRVHLNPRKGGEYKCSSCDKMFGNSEILRLHCQIHGLRQVGAIQERIREQKNNLNQIEKIITSLTNPAEDTTANKSGLTKVRMEDCLRCDACSCIYMDKNDYYKHMRNFHKITDLRTLKSPNSPGHFVLVDKPNKSTIKRKSSTSKAQKQSTQRLENTGPSLEEGYDKLYQTTMKDIIKDRWARMISRSRSRTEEPEELKIKPDPDAEYGDNFFSSSSETTEQDYMTHLLSQVEVKIETE